MWRPCVTRVVLPAISREGREGEGIVIGARVDERTRRFGTAGGHGVVWCGDLGRRRVRPVATHAMCLVLFFSVSRLSSHVQI